MKQLWRWFVLLALGLAPGPALAQASAEFTDAEYQHAIARGIERYELGHWEEARALFERAHAYRPTARTLRALGLVEFELRHYARAETLLSEALLDQRRPLPHALRVEVVNALERARANVGRFEVSLDPADAQITIDGQPVTPSASGVIAIDAGDHALVATRAGYLPYERKLEVTGGQYAPLRIALRPAGVTPQLTAEPRRPAPVPAPAREQRTSGGSVWPVALLGAGGAAIVAGGVLGLLALDSSSRDADDEEADRARGFALASDLAFGAGAVAGGIGLWLLIDDEAGEQEGDGATSATAASLTPWFSARAFGLHAEGRF